MPSSAEPSLCDRLIALWQHFDVGAAFVATQMPSDLGAFAARCPERIAGAGGLRSRHDAMLAAEAGADYAMFGEPPPAYPPPRAGENREGVRRPPFEAVLERVAWWAELFQPPCIGYAASLDEVAPLAQAGADFVALGDWIWTHAQGPAAAVAAAAASLDGPLP